MKGQKHYQRVMPAAVAYNKLLLGIWARKNWEEAKFRRNSSVGAMTKARSHTMLNAKAF